MKITKTWFKTEVELDTDDLNYLYSPDPYKWELLVKILLLIGVDIRNIK